MSDIFAYTVGMNAFVILIRGINVGGKNKVSMAELRAKLEALGFSDVSTYIASGNVLLTSSKSPKQIKAVIEEGLPQWFKLDSELIKVLVLSYDELKAVVANKPKSFGEDPATYYRDAIFLIGLKTADVMPIFNPREGVDKIWPGEGVVYSQRLGSERTKSRLSKIIESPLYKSMTIRSWNTTVKLLTLAGDLQRKVTDREA